MELNRINKLTIGKENYNFSQETHVGNMIGLGGIDITKDVIYSTIDSQTSISITGTCEIGKKTVVVCESSVDTFIDLSSIDNNILISDSSKILEVKSGDIFSLEIYCTDLGKYFLIKKGIDEVSFYGNPGDIVLYDTKNNDFISVAPSKLSSTDYSSSNFSPIGVIVSYTDTGKYYSIISINDLGSDSGMCWGDTKVTGISKDIDGVDNTIQCLLFRGIRDYDSWTPDFSVGSDYPAASCCNMYKTEGTEQGDWYLPVISELINIDSNLINTSIQKISEVYPSATVSGILGNYWTSTEYNLEESYCYSDTDPKKNNVSKSEKKKVRALLKIDSSGVIISRKTIDFNQPIEFTICIDRGESDPTKTVTIEGSNPELLLRKFRRCVAKSSGGKARICFLDDNDTTKFEDGTTANLDGLDGDVMVYFPEFWYLGEESGSKHIWNISTIEKNNYHHSPASLVGVYKGTITEEGLLKSVSGINPILNDGSSNISIKSPTGYNYIDYHQHCVIAWMFLARYGNINSQLVCGKGINPWKTGYTTGSTNNLGIKDTINSTDGSINFLGLEDIWGGLGEIIWGIAVSQNEDGLVIVDDSNRQTEDSAVLGSIYNYSEGYIRDIVSGSFMDIFPKITTSSSDKYYSDYFNSLLNAENILNLNSVIRANSSTIENHDLWPGLFSTRVIGKSSSDERIGYRLGFEGEISIINSSEEYRNPILVPVEFTIHINREESDPSKMVRLTGGDPELLLRRFRRCIVSKESSESSAKIAYLNDINSNYYSNLTPANLDGTSGDVMVYFPEFWYLGETTSSEHTWNISSTEKEGYYHSPASLVGVYKGYVKGSILRSISGVIPLDDAGYGSFRTYAKNAGDGFHLINYHQHCVIAWMFLARYKTTNSQSICGTSKDSSGGFLKTGSTNYLGMMDTNTSISSINSEMLVNFLGIEGCWGHLGEWIDDVYYNQEGNVVVNDKHISVVRDLTISEISTANTISDIYGNSHMDVFPISTTSDSNRYYTDITKLTKGVSENTYSRRSEHTISEDRYSEGVFYLVTNLRSDEHETTLGSRLAYDGDISVVDSI